MSNHGFMEIWFGKLINHINRIFATFAHNWFYIVLILLFPLALYYVGQGGEIINYLFSHGNGWNIFFILLSFELLFYTVWAIPTWSCYGISYLFGRLAPNIREYANLNPEQLFGQLIQEYNGDGNTYYPIRNFSNLPIIIFIYLLINRSLPDSLFSILGVFLFIPIMSIAGHYTKYLITSRIEFRSSSYKHQFIWKGLLVHLILILFSSLLWMFFDYKVWSILFMGILFLWNNAYHYFIEKLPAHVSEIDQTSALFKIGNQRYSSVWILVIVILGLFGFLTASHQLHLLSPIVIANILVGYYILFIDAFIRAPWILSEYIYKKTALESKLRNSFGLIFNVFRLVSIVGVGILIYISFISTANRHNIREYEADIHQSFDYHNRKNLLQYFDGWIINKKLSKDDTIVLVAGQGGGSRAGAWLSMNLDSLAKMDTTFKHRVFAMSTVSGSTSGANMLLNKWYLESKGIYPKEAYTSSLHFFKSIYSYNYLSASFWGLLFSDFFRGIYYYTDGFQTDRNYYHQKDEVAAFSALYDTQYVDEINESLQSDYLYHFMDSNQYKSPLFFINTANTQTGNRAILSPIGNNDTLFYTAVDLYQKFQINHNLPESSGKKKQLPLIAGVMLSQSFPLICAYNYVKGVGNMIDGGLYENTGSNTTYELFHYLKTYRPQFKYKIMILLNSDTQPDKSKMVNSDFLNTFKSVSASPFTGHSYYWLTKLKRDIRPGIDHMIELKLLDHEHKWAKNIPLGIMLTPSSLDTLYSYIRF